MSEDRSHERLGGSTAERWTNCPGSVFLSKDLPPEEPSEAALKGTEAHKVCEKVLEAYLTRKETGETNQEIIKFIQEYPDQEVVENAIDYAEHIWHKLLNQSISDKAWGIEDKFFLSKELEIGGFADFWAVYKGDKGKAVLLIADYKNGYYQVPAEKNVQLACYACMVRHHLREEGKKKGKTIEFEKVVACIFQPKATEKYKEVTFTDKQLDTWEKKFLKAGHQIWVEQKATFKTGKWCHFCRAQAACPKYTKELSFQTGIQLAEPNLEDLPSPEQLPLEVLSRIILASKELSAFLKACRARGIALFRAGTELPDMKVVEGVSRRSWDTDTATVTENLKSLGLAVESLYEKPKLKGLGKIESLLVDAGYKKREAKELLEPSVKYSTPALSLVPANDPREAVKSFPDLLLDEELIEEEE